jgi:hypothetical protein
MKPNVDPATFVPEDSSPEADLAALEAIGVLEAEESTAKVLEEAHAVPTLSDVPTPVPVTVPTPPPAPVTVEIPKEVIQEEHLSSSDTPFKAFQSDSPTTDVNNAIFASALNDAPVQTNTNPFADQKKKKSSKKLIIILIAAIVLIGGGIASYFVWQSMQDTTVVETTNTTGDQPGGTSQPETTDTEASVTDSANLLQSETSAINDSVYDDSSLSDTTLYGN